MENPLTHLLGKSVMFMTASGEEIVMVVKEATPTSLKGTDTEGMNVTLMNNQIDDYLIRK